MLIAISQDGKGRPVIVLGLSDMNIKKLREGNPIFHSPEDNAAMKAVDASVIIIQGPTEEILAEMLRRVLSQGGVPAHLLRDYDGPKVGRGVEVDR